MELRHLETFARVASLGSLSRASEELHVSQPAVTRQIASLERELRTRLFDRLGRRVQLTAAGQVLQEYAVEVLRLSAEAKRAVADVAGGVAGRLAIGASSTAATYVLPRVLSRYRTLYPGVELSVTTSGSARIVALVRESAVDLGVVMGFQAEPGLRAVPLAEHRAVVVAHPSHPLSLEHRERGVRVSDLAGCPLILMQPGTTLRAYVERLLAAAGLPAHPSLEMDSVEAIKRMIAAQLGVSILPLLAVAAEADDGRLAALPLLDAAEDRLRVSAVHREDRYVSAALRSFLQVLVDEAAIADTVRGKPGSL